MNDVIDRLREWTESDYRQCSAAQLRTFRDQLRGAERTALDTAESILLAAARTRRGG